MRTNAEIPRRADTGEPELYRMVKKFPALLALIIASIPFILVAEPNAAPKVNPFEQFDSSEPLAGAAKPAPLAASSDDPFKPIIDSANGVAAYESGDYTTALQLLRPLAEHGSSEAQFYLGLMYREGKGITQDYVEAVRWFRLSADQGYAVAQSSLGFMYFGGKGFPRNFVEAVKWFRLAADQGAARAQWVLGHVYMSGWSVPQDYVTAHMWLNLSAAQGFPFATKDRDAVAALMTAAQIAEAHKLASNWKPTTHVDRGIVGQPTSGSHAGKILTDEPSGFQDAAAAYNKGDYATALRLFRLLADRGYSPAQNNLGRMYFDGRGVPQGYVEALKWFRLAANQGDANAQTSLGAMYVEGHGVPQDYAAALSWYRLAADQGYAVAEMNLGAMYLKGWGVPQDSGVTVRWYRLAADQGYPDAQFALGALYEDGVGVPKDFVHAHMWYNLAYSLYPASDANSDQTYEFRDKLAKRMSPEQVAEAQKLAREWKPKSAR